MQQEIKHILKFSVHGRKADINSVIMFADRVLDQPENKEVKSVKKNMYGNHVLITVFFNSSYTEAAAENILAEASRRFPIDSFILLTARMNYDQKVFTDENKLVDLIYY